MTENDKVLKEKMNKLDTLSAGIVFGKEEAWDKLQARMERKPAKRIAVKYWLAAAAVLLLIISVTTVYFYPSKESANNHEKISAATNIVIQSQAQEVVPKSENVQEQKVSIAVEKENRHIARTIVKDKKTEQPAITIAPAIQTPQNEKVNDNAVTINTPAPVVPIAKQMKVVHINDLGKKEAEQQTKQTIAASTSPGFDLANLPVVHINDVIHEEYEVRRILKENRSMFVQISFMKHGFKYNESPGTDDYQIPHYFLNIKSNPQN